MHKTIQYYKKSVWGNTLYYVAQHLGADMQHAAKNIKALTGRETITASDLNALIGLGFEFHEVFAPDSWMENSNIKKLKNY